MAVTQNEIYEQKALAEPRANFYQGTRAFICPSGTVIQLSKELHYTDFPGTFPTGRTAPKVARTIIEWTPHEALGVPRLTASYESTGIGYGRFYYKTVQEKHKVRYAPGHEGDPAYLVEGKEADGVHEWQVTGGANWRTESHVLLRIDTAYDVDTPPPFTKIHELRDSVNSATFTIGAGVGEIAESKAMFAGVEMSRKRFGNVLDVSFFFDYRYDLWTTAVNSRRGVWVAERHYRWEADSETATERTHLTFRPGMQIQSGTPRTLVASAAATSRVVLPARDLDGLGLSTLTAW